METAVYSQFVHINLTVKFFVIPLLMTKELAFSIRQMRELILYLMYQIYQTFSNYRRNQFVLGALWEIVIWQPHSVVQIH